MTKIMNNELQELHKAYIASLPDRIIFLEEQWGIILKQLSNKTLWIDFFHNAHKLCGSSGIHGFVKLSQSLRKLANILVDCQDETPQDDVIKDIELLMQQIKEEPLIPQEPLIRFN